MRPPVDWRKSTSFDAGVAVNAGFNNGTWVFAQGTTLKTSKGSPDGPFTVNSSVTTLLGSTYTFVVPYVQNSITYGNGLWVVLLSPTAAIYASDPDGTWTLVTLPFTASIVAGGSGYWVICDGGTTYRYASSMDGPWSTPTALPSGANSSNLVYANGYFVVSGSNRYIGYALGSNPASWTTTSALYNSHNVQYIASQNRWIGNVDLGGVFSSTTATPPSSGWANLTMGWSSGFGGARGVAYTGSHYVIFAAVTGGTQVKYSSDPTVAASGWASVLLSGQAGMGNYRCLTGNGVIFHCGDTSNQPIYAPFTDAVNRGVASRIPMHTSVR